MKRKKNGYTLIELLIAVSIMALASVAACMAIYQIFGGTEENNNRMTALHQVQNAGYWISRDAQMAISVNTTDTLAFPEFLHLGWTEWDDAGNPTYHTINYSLQNESNDLYSLKRTHSIFGGTTDEAMVADYIYFQPEAEYSSNSSYNNPDIRVNITSIFDDTRASREYWIKRRAGL